MRRLGVYTWRRREWTRNSQNFLFPFFFWVKMLDLCTSTLLKCGGWRVRMDGCSLFPHLGIQPARRSLVQQTHAADVAALHRLVVVVARVEFGKASFETIFHYSKKKKNSTRIHQHVNNLKPYAFSKSWVNRVQLVRPHRVPPGHLPRRTPGEEDKLRGINHRVVIRFVEKSDG